MKFVDQLIDWNKLFKKLVKRYELDYIFTKTYDSKSDEVCLMTLYIDKRFITLKDDKIFFNDSESYEISFENLTTIIEKIDLFLIKIKDEQMKGEN